MRIGMILDETFPPDPRVGNEADTLIKAGHEVFLFCLKYDQEPLEENIDGIKVRRYTSNKWIYKFSALVFTVPFYSMIMKRKIRHFLQKNKIDCIHIHDMRIAEAVFHANSTSKLPTILDLHDCMPEAMKLYTHVQKFPGKFLISIKKWLKKEEEFIHKVTRVVTASPQYVENIIHRTHIPEEKIKVVPNTVRKSFYEGAIIEDRIIKKFENDFTLLYLGDTSVRRGLLTVMRGLAKVKEDIPTIKLVIVGRSKTDYMLRDEVKKLGIEKFVCFEGWQNVMLFPSYIMASDVCITSLYHNLNHEMAFPNKIFQYMSFGKPLIASNIKAQQKIIEENQTGVIYNADSEDDFAEKIRTLFEDSDLRKKLGENGKQFVRKTFHWEKTSENLTNLYETILDD